mgnify:CR=1 FL=1
MKYQNILTGIILAGGQSKRLGLSKPKPLIKVGGKLLLSRVADSIRPLCKELILVVASDQKDDIPDLGIALGMHVITDTKNFKGPLAGIHAGLSSSISPLSFVVGADYPFISKKLIEKMLAISTSNFNKSYSAVIPKYNGFLHPLHSILPKIVWEKYILDELHKGESSITKLISKSMENNLHKIEIINEKEIGLLDPMFMSLIDIDDKESLNFSRRIVEKRWDLKKN